MVEDALCVRGYWDVPEDFSKAYILDQLKGQIEQIGFLDLKETVYFPQSPGKTFCYTRNSMEITYMSLK